MAKYYDPTTQTTSEVGSPELNPGLIQGKQVVPDTTPLGFGTINSTNLTPTSPINLPQLPTSPDYVGTTGMTQAIIDANSIIVKANQDAIAKANETTTPSAIDTYKADLQGVQTPDLAGLFKSTYDTPEFKAKQDAYTTSKNKLDAYNAQLAGLNYQKETVIPNQLQQDSTGRGITKGGLAPLEASAQRAKLLEIAPIQYQTLLAQAEATGNANILNAAQSHLDKVFSIMSQDAQNKYEFKLKTIDAVYQAADKKEQRILDQQKTDLATNNTTYTNYINDIQTAIKSATDSGDTNLAGQISQLINQPLDPNSKTFKEDYQKALSKLGALQAKIQPNELDNVYKTLQIKKLQQELSSNGVNIEASDLIAYANQYASTGQIPTGLPKGSFGAVAQVAKETPKNEGSIVSTITGIKDSKVPAAEQDDLGRLYNIVNMSDRLKKLDEERIGGLVAGTTGKVFGSEKQSEYLTVRKAIVDEIARMQTGAALTIDEQDFYNDYLPGRFSETLFLGQSSNKKIDNFKSVMESKLKNSLQNRNLSIYGYSPIKLGGSEYKVGDVIEVNGKRGRILPDGTIAEI